MYSKGFLNRSYLWISLFFNSSYFHSFLKYITIVVFQQRQLTALITFFLLFGDFNTQNELNNKLTMKLRPQNENTVN